MTLKITSPLSANSRIHIGFMPDATEINRQIMDGYLQIREQDLLKRSHFFGGRYENLYLQRESIPAIGGVIEQAESFAKNLLEALMRGFVECRIKPYYLHHGDLAPGTAHLRTTLEEGQKLMQALRGRVSGLCQPDYVLDIPGGHGKVPVGPQYLSHERESHDNARYRIVDYCGDVHLYPPAEINAKP